MLGHNTFDKSLLRDDRLAIPPDYVLPMKKRSSTILPFWIV